LASQVTKSEVTVGATMAGVVRDGRASDP
jgi:hypothetical protein